MSTIAIQQETPVTWDIESIFPNGSSSKDYRAFVADIATDLETAGTAREQLPGTLDARGNAAWQQWIEQLQQLAERIGLAHIFVFCLTSQDVDDAPAATLLSQANELYSRWQMLAASLESFAVKQTDDSWEALVSNGPLANVRFYLDELRYNARQKMSEEKEKFALELAVDGYHAWHLLYEKMAGDLRVTVQDNGQPREVSLGQNAPRMTSPDRAVRRDAFEKMEAAWKSRADLAAMVLNSQAGFRLSLYRNRKWESPLVEPLLKARLKRETLDAMWAAIADGGKRLTEYVDAKKRLLGIDRFCWYDQEAPAGTVERKYSFTEAGDFIVNHLGSFSPEMGEFSRHALDNRWVEAEDRPGKRAGGWCSSVPLRKESRIFMTFTGTYDGLSTLAHELGHAYHSFVLKDEPAFVRHYPMTLAETASIFNELRVSDAALENAKTNDEKLALLDVKLSNTLTFFCNIHARYLFDCRFYAERASGVLSTEKLSDMMRQAQKDAFFGILDDEIGYHPLFWVSKLHFFITEMPFYNYPYTFGYLFAKGVYARAMKDGPAFAKNYRALLADTGRMTTEEVAKAHLGVDLTKRDFWDTAVASAMADVDAFVALSKT